jgi:type IX secretion system PorP/SprF family membrane protein
MIIKKSFLAPLLLVFIFLESVNAQQDAQYTQYMFNTMSVNPAYAGSRGQLSIAALYRSQWVGLDGAPKSQTLNLHSPIRNSQLGYGISIVNDEIGDGVVQETYFDAVLSYTVDVSLEGKLSFGLKAGGNLLNLDFQGLRNFDVEPVSADNIENKFSPNVGVGIYYHTNAFYAGLSAPNLLQTDHYCL